MWMTFLLLLTMWYLYNKIGPQLLPWLYLLWFPSVPRTFTFNLVYNLCEIQLNESVLENFNWGGNDHESLLLQNWLLLRHCLGSIHYFHNNWDLIFSYKVILIHNRAFDFINWISPSQTAHFCKITTTL